MPKRAYHTIVLGLGGIGSGALYWLSHRLGEEVLGLEQFELGHPRGGSEDHSRIIRLSYHTPAYVRLAQQAYGAWRAVEADWQRPVMRITGGLDFFPAGGLIPAGDYRSSLESAAVPYEWLSARDAAARWPQFQLEEDVSVLYQAESGLVSPYLANEAHRQLARRNGAAIQDQAPVTQIEAGPTEIAVTAGGVRYTCRRLVIAAGAWTNGALAHFGRRLPLTVTQEQVSYFRASRPEDFEPERFPIWIWMDEPSFYGFPIFGEAGPKAAQDVGGREVTAETRTFEPDPAAQARLRAFLARTLPTALGPEIYTKTCLYTMPPDRDFVLDALPEDGRVFVAVGAGHAFKFASLLGRILSELALDGRTPADVSPFKIDRPLLLLDDPPRQFMV